MKIITEKEVQEQTLVVNDVLSIELRQVGKEYLEIRLVPHYENSAYFVVHDFQGIPHTVSIPALNQIVLNQIMK